MSTLHGVDGDYRITEVELSAGTLPPVVPTGAERCRGRAVGAQHEASVVRGSPASICHWTDDGSHDELLVMHAGRILLFEYEAANGDSSPFRQMVATIRLYPANKS